MRASRPGPQASGLKPHIKQRVTNRLIDIVLLGFCFLMLLPLLLLIGNAFKSPQELLEWPPSMVPNDFTFDNIRSVLNDTPLLQWMLNSLLFAVMSTIAILSTSAIAGYILGKFRFKTLTVIFVVILATAIVPFEVYMIPLYFQVQGMGLLNSVWGLLIGYLVMSFGIFLIRQNVIVAVPDELLEAARMDGAGESWIFVRIVVPLLRGPLGALGVLAFFQAWTAFAWPLIVATTKKSYTVEVGLALFQTGFTIDFGRLSAAAAIVLIPSITCFVFLRRNLRAGSRDKRPEGLIMEDRGWLASARAAYLRANADSLRWLLDRGTLPHGAFLNSKQNSITLRDYDDGDGWRGPSIVYGWIQGRGLEALVRHATFFEQDDKALAARLWPVARALYADLSTLYQRHDDHAYFSYDRDLQPIRVGPDGAPTPQNAATTVRTYSDIFVLKGLICAAQAIDPCATRRYVANLTDVVGAVVDDTFVGDETQPLDAEGVAPARDFGPRMILLGAAAMLRDIGLPDDAGFGALLIDQVITRHVADGRGAKPRGAVCDIAGQDRCNPGHAIEFAGFALDYIPDDADPGLVDLICEILLTAFRLGYSSPGIRQTVSLSGGQPISDKRPWWSLPETVRAASLAFRRTSNPACLTVWQQAHAAFFDHYWRGDPPIAYQTRDDTGPVDHVPATPDLDPGYHTGLSFLDAIRVISAL